MMILESPNLGLFIGVSCHAAFVVGQLFTTWRSHWRLERMPFVLCLLALLFLTELVLAIGPLRPLVSVDGNAGRFAALQFGGVLLTLALLGAAAAARSRDACGRTGAGFLLNVPLLNLWLLIARPRSSGASDTGWFHRQVTGANGLRLIAVLTVLCIAGSIWHEKQMKLQAIEAVRIAEEKARAAAEAEKQSRQERLLAELDQFVVEVDAPYALNDSFTFSEVVVKGIDLVIGLDTSDWFIHRESDAHYYTGVFCRLPGIRGLLFQGVGVTVDIRDPDGSLAISFEYGSSDCDR